MQVEKQCAVCRSPFSVPPSRELTAKTCSQKCRGKLIAASYAEKRAECVCKACGAVFHVPPCHAARRKFCSDKCAKPHRNSGALRGSDHYKWNGGKANHSDGYLYLASPSHPFGGRSCSYVFEHRLVMEEWMRKEAPGHPFLVDINGEQYLRQDIHVHHINTNKKDNRRENLLACTSAGHLSIHDGKAPMIGEVWPEIDGLVKFEPRRFTKHCELCGSEFSVKLSMVKRGDGRFCSRVCYNNRQRKPFKVNLTQQRGK